MELRKSLIFLAGAAGAIGAKYLARKDAKQLLVVGCGEIATFLIAATPSYEPLIKEEWVQPGTHFSCVGSDMTGKQEIDSSIFKNARIFGDDVSQCLCVGECEKPYKEGVFTHLDGEIGEVIAGNIIGRNSEEEITIFDSTGIALQDLASAAVILKEAEKHGYGVMADI